MKVTDPHELLERIDTAVVKDTKTAVGKKRSSEQAQRGSSLHYVEPFQRAVHSPDPIGESRLRSKSPPSALQVSKKGSLIEGRVQILGDFVDTDAVCLLPDIIKRLSISDTIYSLHLRPS